MDKRVVKKTIGFVLQVALVVAMAFVLFWPVKIDGASMEPALKENKFYFESRLAAHLTVPKRGDVVLLRVEGIDKDIIKRVIGLPGETVLIRDGHVYVGGEMLYEDYISEPTRGDAEYETEEGCFFVMGDNRSVSKDSRVFGAVPAENIKGVMLLNEKKKEN